MPKQLSFQATIETPEVVGLQFELAGIGTRSAAYLADFILRMFVLALVIASISLYRRSFHLDKLWSGKDLELLSLLLFLQGLLLLV